MKTITFWVLFLFAGSLVMAQHDTISRLRPSKNNVSVEVNFIPFSSDAPISIDGFRGRFFLNDKLAIRVGCNIATKKTYRELPTIYGSNTYLNSYDERYTTLGVTSGVEYHFLKSRRFSPYAGIVIGYENKTSRGVYNNATMVGSGSTYSYAMVKTEVANAWEVSSGSGGYAERGYSSFSGNLVLGADFYIIKHLYFGLELGIGYTSLVNKEIVVNVDGSLSTKVPKATESDFGINVNNAIRLGFWF